MAKNTSITFSIVLLLSLLSLIKSQSEWINYNKGKGFEKPEKTYERVSNFAVQFTVNDEFDTTYDGPLYMKIEVTVKEGEMAPLLCFSNKDFSCGNREILVRNLYGNSVYFWVKKQQFLEQGTEPYFVVTCPGNKEQCTYSIKGSDSGTAAMEFEPNNVFSYLVTDKNPEMDVIIKNQTAYSNGDIMIICLDGSRKASITMKSTGSSFDIDTIHCVYLPASLHEPDWGKFTIKANEGDYLTLSIHKYTLEGDQVNLGRADPGYLLPNGPVVTGFIRGDTIEECFPISKDILDKSSNKLYIVGKIHSKYATFFLRDENENLIQDTNIEIIDGQLSYVLNNPKKDRYICFKRPVDETYTQGYVIFSFQIIDYDKLNSIGNYTYTEPMNTGVIYRRLLPKGQVAYFYGSEDDTSLRKYDYTLSNIKGLAKLYITLCNGFPNCYYTKEDLDTMNEIKVSHANNHMIWTTDEYSSSAIGPYKNVMVVYCEDSNLNGDYCEFDTSIFLRGQNIELIENQKLYKYILKGEKGNLVIDLHENRIVSRITVDIMIFNGDVYFSVLNKEEGLTVQKNYLSNKVLFNLIMPRRTLENPQVIIEFEGNLNSFFDIRYTVDSQSTEQSAEFLSSGESYLVQINPLSTTKTKTVSINNIYGDKTPFMTNFFALNCEFEIKRGNEKIVVSDGYAQDNIEAGKLVNGYYTYNIRILEQDLSDYLNKMCMLYVAGYEIVNNENDTDIPREIIVGENINQQIIFKDNFKKVRFTYPIANITKDLTYHINVIDRAYYKLIGYLNGQLLFKDESVAVTKTNYMLGEELSSYCKKNELCSFSLDVEMVEKIVTTDPMIEITFREILNIPTYLQKGSAKLDYVCGDRFYYLYTDIGRNDEGEITLNFLREFGNLWAKIVKKDLHTPQEEANWRKYYRMPGPAWEDSLPFNNYTKKLKINKKDTEDCLNGCYLLMTIQINEIGDYIPDHIFYSFSIIVQASPSSKAYTQIPKVIIQVDEFIVGALDVTEMDEQYISQFYEIWLPHDSDTVELDWQSSLAALYINVGGKRPSTKSADFTLYPPGRDSLISINKKDILEKGKKRGVIAQDVNSLEDINLVIGVWTNKTDSVNDELYSLRVHQYIENETEDLGIIEVNSDQKVICKPQKFREGYSYSYRCLFMISFNSDPSILAPIYIYGYSTNPAATVSLFGSFINQTDYNSYNKETIRNLIPSRQNAEYNTYYDGVNYIHVSELPYNKYFFINLYSDLPDDLVFINSVPIFNLIAEGLIAEIFPNSHTEQLFACKKNQLSMIFPGQDGIATTIEVITGEAEIGWNGEDVHKVKGAEDRITLFSEKDKRNLLIRNTNPKINQLKADIEDPGFFFYISYQARMNGVNFDEIKFQKTTEISYKNTDLPAILYCKLGLVYKDLNIAIQFKDILGVNEGQYNESPIRVIASIMKEDTIYAARKNAQTDIVPSREKSVYGFYDPAIKTALIYLSKNKIDSYNLKESDHPTLYLRLDKANNQDIIFSKFDIETRVAGINDHVIPVEKVYHYGKLGEWQDSVFYKLKLQKNRLFMRVQVALNSAELDFTLNQEMNKFEQNQTYDEWRSSRERGKVIITFIQPDIDFIYLNIFRKKRGVQGNEKLSNYAFKYITADHEYDFFDYKSMSPNIECKESAGSFEDSDMIECVFNQIHSDVGVINVTYFLKVVENSTYIYGEEMSTIAVTESPNVVYYKKNPEVGIEGDYDKISMKIEGYLSNWASINIIAQIQQNNIIEYSAYNALMNIRPDPNKKDDEEKKEDNKKESPDNTVLFGVIGGVLGIIVIVLIIVIIYFQIKNRNLMNQVKHVSFQKTNANVDPNLLLQKNADSINQ